jgi:hypothetical protein
VTLTDQEDRHTWKLESDGAFSSKSAYRAFFEGSSTFEPWKRIWKTWAPNKCKMFMWLAVRNRCWTSDRFARRGLPHPNRCPLCDQEDETIQHLLASCVVARQVWFSLFSTLNLSTWAPRQQDNNFTEWWRKVSRKINKEKRKGLNSLILGAWSIWKHQNDRIFKAESPSVSLILSKFRDEHSLWCLAGAKNLQAFSICETN